MAIASQRAHGLSRHLPSLGGIKVPTWVSDIFSAPLTQSNDTITTLNATIAARTGDLPSMHTGLSTRMLSVAGPTHAQGAYQRALPMTEESWKEVFSVYMSNMITDIWKSDQQSLTIACCLFVLLLCLLAVLCLLACKSLWARFVKPLIIGREMDMTSQLTHRLSATAEKIENQQHRRETFWREQRDGTTQMAETMLKQQQETLDAIKTTQADQKRQESAFDLISDRINSIESVLQAPKPEPVASQPSIDQDVLVTQIVEKTKEAVEKVLEVSLSMMLKSQATNSPIRQVLEHDADNKTRPTVRAEVSRDCIEQLESKIDRLVADRMKDRLVLESVARVHVLAYDRLDEDDSLVLDKEIRDLSHLVGLDGSGAIFQSPRRRTFGLASSRGIGRRHFRPHNGRDVPKDDTSGKVALTSVEVVAASQVSAPDIQPPTTSTSQETLLASAPECAKPAYCDSSIEPLPARRPRKRLGAGYSKHGLHGTSEISTRVAGASPRAHPANSQETQFINPVIEDAGEPEKFEKTTALPESALASSTLVEHFHVTTAKSVEPVPSQDDSHDSSNLLGQPSMHEQEVIDLTSQSDEEGQSNLESPIVTLDLLPEDHGPNEVNVQISRDAEVDTAEACTESTQPQEPVASFKPDADVVEPDHGDEAERTQSAAQPTGTYVPLSFTDKSISQFESGLDELRAPVGDMSMEHQQALLRYVQVDEPQDQPAGELPGTLSAGESTKVPSAAGLNGDPEPVEGAGLWASPMLDFDQPLDPVLHHELFPGGCDTLDQPDRYSTGVTGQISNLTAPSLSDLDQLIQDLVEETDHRSTLVLSEESSLKGYEEHSMNTSAEELPGQLQGSAAFDTADSPTSRAWKNLRSLRTTGVDHKSHQRNFLRGRKALRAFQRMISKAHMTPQ